MSHATTATVHFVLRFFAIIVEITTNRIVCHCLRAGGVMVGEPGGSDGESKFVPDFAAIANFKISNSRREIVVLLSYIFFAMSAM